MTKIKTAQAWGFVFSGTPVITDKYDGAEPVVIVHGLTEAEVHEAAALLAKSREVCELTEHQSDEYGADYIMSCGGVIKDCAHIYAKPVFCPSCGRKVVVK